MGTARAGMSFVWNQKCDASSFDCRSTLLQKASLNYSYASARARARLTETTYVFGANFGGFSVICPFEAKSGW